MKINIRIFKILSLFLIFLIGGCGKDKAPEFDGLIPARTVLDTYKSLENKEHKASLMKIQRLRDLDPSNVFLANLEILEKTNSVISEAQIKINNGDIEGALAVVSDGKRKYGGHKDLVDTEEKLKIFKRIEEILDIFRKPRDSTQLKLSAVQLKKLGEKYKSAAIFIPLSEKKLIESKIMHEWEMKRAVSSLCSQINDLLIEHDPDVELLYAVLEIEDPDNPMLMKYMEYLNGADVDLVIYPEENIFADDDENKEDKKQNKVPEKEKKTEEEKKGSWWDKFSF